MPNQKHQEQAVVETIDRRLVELQQREAAQKIEKPESNAVTVAQKKSPKSQKISATKAEIVAKPKLVTPKPKTPPTAKPLVEAPKLQPPVAVQKPPERVVEVQKAAIERPLVEPQISQIYEVGVIDHEQVEPLETVLAGAESSFYGPIVEWEEGELLLTAPFDVAETSTDTKLDLPVPDLLTEDYFQAGFEAAPEQRLVPRYEEEELIEQISEKLDNLSIESTAEVQGIMDAVVQEIQKLELFEAEGDEAAAEAVEARLEKLVTRLLNVLDIEPHEQTVNHFIKQLKVLVAEQMEEQELAEDEGTHERKFSLQYLLKTLLKKVQEHHMPHLKLGRLVCQRLAPSSIL